MTDPIKDGGPAFPVPGLQDDADFNGLSLRDFIAAKALAGLCANPGGPFQADARCGWSIVNCTFDQIAEEAYGLADAMLRAREASHV